MSALEELNLAAAPHIPVLINDILRIAEPVKGRWLDGTLGAGGYTKALLEAGAEHVTGIDRDPSVFAPLQGLVDAFKGRLNFVEDVFSNFAAYESGLNGIVLDLGVSSMQLDQESRGFSFMRDGPLDMRMSQAGQSAANLVNNLGESDLANILFAYGEERASRRIARALVSRRQSQPFERTLDLARVIEGVLPRSKPGQIHPATRSFQALRIAVNREFDELFHGLQNAEDALLPGGLLMVVTFHSIEDRMVKRFFQMCSGQGQNANRFAPEVKSAHPTFDLVTRKAVVAAAEELDRNPRARSARLRVGRRTEAPRSTRLSAKDLGIPSVEGKRRA
jgi:16S rRNA (cytosine1402-N4)-methyltransferase